jgi:hypothetical protein
MFGDVVREAHARKIRVVGRFDFSKTPKAVFDAHPEWFFRQTGGQPVIYNGLYSTCINGGYYRDQAMKILSEALDKYAVDGLFFNMFGNQSRDYGGRQVGLCHCDQCKRKYRQMYKKEIPETADDDYRTFMFTSSREVAAAIGDLIRKKRPQAGYFNYIQEYTDGIMSESNTAVARPLPLWPYSASDHVNRARNSEPGKMANRPQHAVRGLLVALCYRSAPGDRATVMAEPRERWRFDIRSERHAGSTGSAGIGDGKTSLPLGCRTMNNIMPVRRARPASYCWGRPPRPDARLAKTRTEACSGC